LKKKPSLDTTQRLEALLRALDERPLASDDVRQLRAVEVVEIAATDDAKTLLGDWARGTVGVPLTEEARAALARLGTIRK
jgi:hypothetical protein